jgi:hypothetical protein
MNNFFKLNKHTIKIFAADIGVMSVSDFLVMLPDVIQYLLEELITPINAEGYNYNNGTPHLDADNKQIHQLQRFAFLYILTIPNFTYLKFSTTQILKLWGELFYWVITIINLNQCPNVPGKIRTEVFTGKIPNFREISILPIIAILNILRYQINKELNLTTYYWQQALYVGPSLSVPGCLRAAVIITNKTVQIIITFNNIKSISDGGDLNIHKYSVNPLEYPKDTELYHDEPNIDHENKILIISIPNQSSDPVDSVSDCLDIIDKSPRESSTYLQPHNCEINESDDERSFARNTDDSDTQLLSTKHNKNNNDNTNIIINDINTSRSAATAVRQKTTLTSNANELRGDNVIFNSNNIDRVQNITLSNNYIPFDKVRGDEDASKTKKLEKSKQKSKSETNLNNNNNKIPSKKKLTFAENLQKYKTDFLNTKKQDERLRLANIPFINQFYELLGALYGTRDAPRDYNDHSAKTLVNDMRCKILHFCSCTYVKLDTEVVDNIEKKIFMFVFQFLMNK